MSDRLASATRETFASFQVRNFRLFFLGQGISQVGQLADPDRPDACWSSTSPAAAWPSASWPPASSGRSCCSGRGPAWSPTAATSAGSCSIVQVVAMAQSFAARRLWPSWTTRRWPPCSPWPRSAGLCMAFDNPARRSFVVEMVPEDLVHNAVSLNSAMMTSSRVIGPALAGLLITTVGYGWAFVVDGVVLRRRARRALADAHRGAPPGDRSPVGARARCGTACATSGDTPVLAIPLVMMAVVGTLAFNFQVVLPLIVTRTFDQSQGGLHPPLLVHQRSGRWSAPSGPPDGAASG